MKYQLVDPDEGQAVTTGLIERIGVGGSEPGHAAHKQDGEMFEFVGVIADHAAAIEVMKGLFDRAGRPIERSGLAGVGHRVVHGGSLFGDPTLIDRQVLAAIKELSVLAPLHNPANAIGIEQAMLAFPDVPQVAVFDTAFFRDLPPAAATYAIDRAVAAEYQVRRYGFHGTSHQYVAGQVAQALGRDLAGLRQIVLHLGNGASVSAVDGGRAPYPAHGAVGPPPGPDAFEPVHRQRRDAGGRSATGKGDDAHPQRSRRWKMTDGTLRRTNMMGRQRPGT